MAVDAKQDYINGRRELARRASIAVIERSPVVRCDMQDYVDELGMRGRRPVVFGKLPTGVAAGVSLWMPDGSVYVSLQNVAEMPAKLIQFGIVAEKPTLVVIDKEFSPYIEGEPVGHLSYAHTSQKAADAFTHTNDPLSNHASWTAESGGAYVKSDGAQLVHNAPGATARVDYYAFTGYTPGSADYSAEMLCRTTYVSNLGRTWGPNVRQQSGAATTYNGRLDGAGNGTLSMNRYVAGAVTQLAISGAGVGLLLTVRLEIVGQVLIAYYGGEAVSITATDNSGDKITGVGKGGFRSGQAANATGSSYADDWQLLEAAVASSRRRRLICGD